MALQWTQTEGKTLGDHAAPAHAHPPAPTHALPPAPTHAHPPATPLAPCSSYLHLL